MYIPNGALPTRGYLCNHALPAAAGAVTCRVHIQFGECISPTVHCPLVGICATTLFRLLPGLSLAGSTLITPDSGYTFFPAVSSLSRSFTMGSLALRLGFPGVEF